MLFGRRTAKNFVFVLQAVRCDGKLMVDVQSGGHTLRALYVWHPVASGYADVQ